MTSFNMFDFFHEAGVDVVVFDDDGVHSLPGKKRWFVVLEEDERFAWSETQGWVHREGNTHDEYTDTERENFKLPPNGVWEAI